LFEKVKQVAKRQTARLLGLALPLPVKSIGRTYGIAPHRNERIFNKRLN